MRVSLKTLLLYSLRHNKFNCTTNRVQVQLLQQMFGMFSFFLHAGPKSLLPFDDSIINESATVHSMCLSSTASDLSHLELVSDKPDPAFDLIFDSLRG